MAYIELKCRLSANEYGEDILTAYLGEEGFESFEVKPNGDYYAFVREDQLNVSAVEELLKGLDFVEKFTFRKVPEENWNAVWESNFPSVEITPECIVRAPFHGDQSAYKYDLIIEPQMSFGTAHHETTSQMLQFLLEEDVAKKRLLDMGSGTGVLAILAHKKGAVEIAAIDNDDWAYRNAKHNCELNGIDAIEVVCGDASNLKGRIYDIILANINRNILINDMGAYVNALVSGGTLIMSGFFLADLPLIKSAAKSHQLEYVTHLMKNQWVAVKFIKTV